MKLRMAFATALVGGCAATGGIALADHGEAGRFPVCSGAWVRNAPNDHATVIGTLTNPQTFEVKQDAANGFDYGFAYGNVNKYGYVPDADLC